MRNAEEPEISVGQAASGQSVPQFKMKNGWVIFDVPAGTPPITNQTLDEWEAAEYQEEYRRAFSPRR